MNLIKFFILTGISACLLFCSCNKPSDDQPPQPTSKALTPFTIAVTNRQASTVNLNWSASVNNNNSSPVKYKVLLGAVTLATDLSTTTYPVTGLVAANTYSGKIMAYTSSGDTASVVFTIGQFTVTFPDYSYVNGYYKVTETSTLVSTGAVANYTFAAKVQLLNDSVIYFTQANRKPPTWWMADFPTTIYPAMGDTLIGGGITPRGRILNTTTIRMSYLFGASSGVYSVKQMWQKLANPADTNLIVYTYPNFSGMIKTVAGKSFGTASGSTGDGGLATAAGLVFPNDVTTDNSGNIYLTDGGTGYSVRKVATTGIITRYAGNNTSGFSGDGGQAINAQLSSPQGVVMDNSGNLYIADGGNRVIRKVAANGIITTIAGTPGVYGYSGDGGPATSAQLGFPSGLALDASGNLYVADPGKHVIRKIATNGIITTYAGNGTAGFGGDGGPATSAMLNTPNDIVIDASNTMYIADKANNVIRKITAAGVISTYAGTSGFSGGGFSGDGGLATSAKMHMPQSVSLDNTGNLFISDYSNNRIRKVTPGGIISTYAGTGLTGTWGNGPDFYAGDYGAATVASIDYPYGIFWTSTGLLISGGSHRIRKIQF